MFSLRYNQGEPCSSARLREGQYESTFQIAIVFFRFFLTQRELDWRVYTSLASSFVTIGGAENLLTFAGEDILTGVSLPKKLKIVAHNCPVFVLTTFFRIAASLRRPFLPEWATMALACTPMSLRSSFQFLSSLPCLSSSSPSSSTSFPWSPLAT